MHLLYIVCMFKALGNYHEKTVQHEKAREIDKMYYTRLYFLRLFFVYVYVAVVCRHHCGHLRFKSRKKIEK